MKIKDLKNYWPPTTWSPALSMPVHDGVLVSSAWRASAHLLRGAQFQLRVRVNEAEHTATWLIQCDPPLTPAHVHATFEAHRGRRLLEIGDIEIALGGRKRLVA